MRLPRELPNSKLSLGRVVASQTVNLEGRQLQRTPPECLNNRYLAQKAQMKHSIQIPNKHCPTGDNT